MATSTTSIRRRDWLGTVLLLPLLAGCFGQVGDPPEPTSTTSGPAPSPTDEPTTAPRKESSDGAEARIQESVVTATEDSTGEMASYAVVLDNPSADIALLTVIEVTLYDADGRRVKDLVVDRHVVTHSVHLVMPGDRQTFAKLTYVDREVASMEVEVVDTALWYAADDDRIQPVEAIDVASADDEVSFRVDWPYQPEPVTTVATYLAFRDADGKLVGGMADYDEYTPGANEHTIEIDSAIPDHWDRVEVHIDPFPQHRS